MYVYIYIYIYIYAYNTLSFKEVLLHLCPWRIPDHGTLHDNHLHTCILNTKVWWSSSSCKQPQKGLSDAWQTTVCPKSVCKYDWPIRSKTSSVRRVQGEGLPYLHWFFFFFFFVSRACGQYHGGTAACRLIVLTLSPPACLDVPTFTGRCPHVPSDVRDPSSKRGN